MSIFSDVAALRPARRFSKYARPTLITGWAEQAGLSAHLPGGVSCLGQIWLCNADFAFCHEFLQLVNVSLLWEALDPWCRDRDIVTAARQDIVARAAIGSITWCHSCPADVQMSQYTAFETVWRELRRGNNVAVYCLESKHRSPASLVAFFVGYLGITAQDAMELVRQHPASRLSEYRPGCLRQLLNCPPFAGYRTAAEGVAGDPTAGVAGAASSTSAPPAAPVGLGG